MWFVGNTGGKNNLMLVFLKRHIRGAVVGALVINILACAAPTPKSEPPSLSASSKTGSQN